LNQSKDKFEQLANVLMLGRHIDAQILLQAVDYANRTGSPTFGAVRFYLEAHKLSIDNHGQAITDVADLVVVDKPQLVEYDILFKTGGDNDE